MKILLSPVADAPTSAPVAPAPAAAPPSAPTQPAAPSGPVAGDNLWDDPELAEAETTTKPIVPDKKPDAKAPEKPVVKPPEKAPEKKSETPPEPAPEKGKNLIDNKNFRKMLEGAQEKARVLEQQRIPELEAKIKEWESKGKDTEKLTARLAELEKQLEEREKRIYSLNVAESKDFQDKYVKPFNEAASEAEAEINRMEIQIKGKNEEGEVVVTGTRKADFKTDFAKIFHTNKESATEASRMARDLFGDDGPAVMDMVRNLYRLDRSKQRALQEAQTNAESNRQKEIADKAKFQEWQDKSFTDATRDMTEKNPEFFQPDPKDKQRAEIFNKALKIASAAYDSRDSLTPAQLIALDATNRLQSAGFRVAKYDLAKAKERIAEFLESLG